MTQKQRVLRSLRAAGVAGVTQADWTGCYRPTPDGGPPILRLPARILELQQDGFTVRKGALRDRCRVYSLEITDPIEISHSEAAVLFPKPAASPYDYELAS